MAGLFAIILDREGNLLDLDNLPAKAAKAARIAVNRSAEKARAASARRARARANFPARYVSAAEGRLAVKTKATDSSLTAVVSARQRPTSLARFVSGPAKARQVGARVQVKPGVAKYLKNAIFVKLRQGQASTDTKFNLGLAVRTKGNRRPSAAYKPVQMKNGLWLLYGPSVSQALLSARGTGIWPEMTDEVFDNMMSEFYRQLDLTNV